MILEDMMNTYKIKDTVTGKYKSSGDSWTSRGKAYVEAGHVTLALKHLVPTLAHKDFWKRFYASEESKGKPTGYYNNWTVYNLPGEWKKEYNKAVDWKQLPEYMPGLVIEVYSITGIKVIPIEQWIESRDK